MCYTHSSSRFYKNKHDCKIPINGSNHFGRIIPLRFYYAEWILLTVKRGKRSPSSSWRSLSPSRNRGFIIEPVQPTDRQLLTTRDSPHYSAVDVGGRRPSPPPPDRILIVCRPAHPSVSWAPQWNDSLMPNESDHQMRIRTHQPASHPPPVFLLHHILTSRALLLVGGGVPG